MVSNEIENLINIISKLPGLGPRSARRAVLELLFCRLRRQALVLGGVGVFPQADADGSRPIFRAAGVVVADGLVYGRDARVHPRSLQATTVQAAFR